MNAITSKKDIHPLLENCISGYTEGSKNGIKPLVL